MLNPFQMLTMDFKLNYLGNFPTSLKIPVINWKVELKLKWTKHCLLATAGVHNDNANSDIIFTVKDTKLYVPLVTLSAKDNQKS